MTPSVKHAAVMNFLIVIIVEVSQSVGRDNGTADFTSADDQADVLKRIFVIGETFHYPCPAAAELIGSGGGRTAVW